jgi:hypothetical protein
LGTTWLVAPYRYEGVDNGGLGDVVADCFEFGVLAA